MNYRGRRPRLRGMCPHGKYGRSSYKYKPRFQPSEHRRSPEDDLTEAERFIIDEYEQLDHSKRREKRWPRDEEEEERRVRHRGRSDDEEERYSRSRSRDRFISRGSRDRERGGRSSWHGSREHSMHREKVKEHDYREDEHEHRAEVQEYTRHDSEEPGRYYNDGAIDLREIIRNREEMRSPRTEPERNRSRNRYYDQDATHEHEQGDYFDGAPLENNVQDRNYDGVPLSDFQHAVHEHSRKRTRWSEQNHLSDDKSSKSSAPYAAPAQVDQFKAQTSQHSEDTTYPGQFISVKDSHPDIPLFDGLNQDITSKQFLQIIDDLGVKYRWPSDARKFQMAAKLQGAPKEWLMKDDRMCQEPWEKIKSMFVKAHPSDMDYHQLLVRMMERTKYENESFGNYFMLKTMLMNAVGISGRRAVSCLIGGLQNPNLRKYCIQKNFPTPDALYSYLNSKGPDVDSVPNQKKANSNSSPQKSDQYASGTNLKNTNSKSSGNHRDPIATINLVNDHKPYSMSSANYELKHLLTVKIKNNLLDAYNDMSAHCLTITEEIAKSIHLEYNKRRTTVIGFRGVPVLALGDCEVTIGADQAVIRIRIYVVPSISQEKPVVIGKCFREHQDLNYVETDNGISFKQPKSYQNSFSMNEKRKEKT